MSVELFNRDGHRVVVFHDLVRGEAGVQANQVLIVRGKHSLLADPGGALLYTPVSTAVSGIVPLKELSYVFASHQDPDVIGSLDRWLIYSQARIVCSKLWGRFIPHNVPHYLEIGDDRYIQLPDEGAELPFGDASLFCLPAHFLHSVGNFNLYDPTSKLLFSGDVGASMYDHGDYFAVSDFSAHVRHMEGFHRRYMASNKACRMWVQMVRSLKVEIIVPQHGLPFVGRAIIEQFLDWLEDLECGIDLMTAPGCFRNSAPAVRGVVRHAHSI